MLFKAEINTEMLKDALKPISAVNDEAVLNITEEGWSVNVVNVENVAMVLFKLDKGAFDMFNFEPEQSTDNFKCGLNFEQLLKMLELWERGKVELELLFFEQQLLLRSGIFTYHIPLVEPSALRKEAKIPEISYSAQRIIGADIFTRAVRSIGCVSDEVLFTTDTDGHNIIMEGKGEHDIIRANLGRYTIIPDYPQFPRSLFALDYLLMLCKEISPEKILTLSVSDCHVLQVDFDVAHGAGEVSYLLAPKISPEER